MNKFITTLRNIWSIEELRKRILQTILIILIFRIGSHVVLPGVDVAKLKDLTESNGLLGLLNTLVGGAFKNASIMALGIMPYISASIAIQLLTLALPYFSKLQLACLDHPVTVIDTGSWIKSKRAALKLGVDCPCVDLFFKKERDAARFRAQTPLFVEATIL